MRLISPTWLSEPLPLLGRLQHKLALLQQQCEEKQQLSLSLQSELQIYESFCENSKKGLKGKRAPSPFSLKPEGEGGAVNMSRSSLGTLKDRLKESLYPLNNKMQLNQEQDYIMVYIKKCPRAVTI